METTGALVVHNWIKNYNPDPGLCPIENIVYLAGAHSGGLRMRNWLVGFVVFGIAYAVFVIAIFAVNWPTLENPRLYTTLESKLSDSVRDSVIKVVRRSAFPEIDSNFSVNEQAYELEDGSLTSTIAIINGHLIILQMNTTAEQARVVAQQYVGLIESRVARKSREQLSQLLGVLFIPLGVFIFFTFPARWLWNQLLKLH